MSFSINTNVASLQAQNYLRANSDFQGKTINRVTSGLRIVSSGDDAAGLAIANGFRSDEAVDRVGILVFGNGNLPQRLEGPVLLGFRCDDLFRPCGGVVLAEQADDVRR